MPGSIPLYMDDHVYWTLESEHGCKFCGRNDIMEFDIISEEFMVIPCPVPTGTCCMYHQTYLLNINGILSFLLFAPQKITIWRLEDHATRSWTANEYPLGLNLCYGRDRVRGIAVVDGNLAVLYEGRLLVCNLMDGTVKSCHRKKYCGNVSFFPHQTSLASLSNCKHAIKIYQDDKV